MEWFERVLDFSTPFGAALSTFVLTLIGIFLAVKTWNLMLIKTKKSRMKIHERIDDAEKDIADEKNDMMLMQNDIRNIRETVDKVESETRLIAAGMHAVEGYIRGRNGVVKKE